MPVHHLKKINELLAGGEFLLEAREDRLLVRLPIHEQAGLVVISTQLEGLVINFELMNLIPPQAVRQSEHLGAFLWFITQQNWKTAAGSCELDKDGELRVVVEIPQADAEFTSKQLSLVFNLLRQHGQTILTDGLAVLQTGEIPADEPPTQVDAARREQSSAQAILLKFVEMAESAAGRGQLAAIANPQSGLPAEVREMARLVLAKTGPAEL